MLPLDTEDRKPVLSDASSTIPKDPDSDDECKPSISCKTEVSVPPMDLLQHELQLKEEDYKKLDKMKNPKIKKAGNMMLHRDTLRARFQALGPSGLDLYPITLDKGTLDFMVSRDFMASVYGGSMQATRPSIGKKLKERHGMDDFMYLHPSYQPVAPQVPGACGLFFETHTSIGSDWPEVQRVFTRIDSNIWQYMGMYRLMSSPSLTTREWNDQEPKVQKTWGREICRQNWGSHVRARVFARKRLGREPTTDEIEDLSEEGSRAYSVTPEEIMLAFSNGQEELGIWLMECVGYDNAFQLELCDKFPLWVPPTKASKAPKSSKKRRGSGKSPTKSSKVAGRKRKRGESFADSDDDRNEVESEGATGSAEIDNLSEDEEEGPTYRPRGTRSRPICL